MRRTYPPIDRSTLQQMSASPPNRLPHTEPPIDLASEDGVAALVPRTQALLAAGDLAGYGALLALTQEIDDPDRRYWATVKSIECGLAAAATCSRANLATLYAALAGGGLEALAREPREPVLLNYAGVALYELWSLDAARALFEAARRLDPALPGVSGNLAAVRRRQQELARGGGRGQAPPQPAALARRAGELAARARPAEGLRVSLCMIVRDEQEMLPRSLAAVADAVDEIVVVDTGSTDRTIEIARSYGAHVIERAWTGSFAQARNVGLDAASGDWLLVLDADEVLVEEDAPLLRSLLGQTWREAFYLTEINHTGELEIGAAVTHDTMRLFRNRPAYRYSGRLHEQIAHNLPGYLPERLRASGVRIEHYGYLSAVRDTRAKSERNIELLRLQQEEAPPSAFLHYNLGSEHAAAGEEQAALRELRRAWELLEADPEADSYHFAPALANRLVRALRVCGQQEEAVAQAERGLERFPGFTDLVFEQATARHIAGELERAIELYERCIEMGDAPQRYTATVGCGTYLPRLALAELYLQRGEAARALELCTYCLREHAGFTGAVLPYATAMLATGADPVSVVDAVQALLGAELAPAARFMLGTALCERGASAAAEAQFRAVHECQPHSGRARVALAEVLLAQRRYAEAAELAAGVPVDDPLACAACRSELFARLVQVDVDSASPDAAGYLQATDPAAADRPSERAEAAAPKLDDTSERDRPTAPTQDDTSERDRPTAPTQDDTSERDQPTAPTQDDTSERDQPTAPTQDDTSERDQPTAPTQDDTSERDRPTAPTQDDTSEHTRSAELAAVDVALERAAAAAVPAAELALFAAWRELAATGSAEVELPADAVGPLETILRALLLVRDFKHFESLVALLERTPLAGRERSELLAQAYFDRGLPAAAAEEWLAICRVSPDARALLGLARVAERQGLATEAADFARALLEREPESRAGAELLARVSPAGVSSTQLQAA
jgi:tetratricopeptide (TPR) repeat protein